MVSAGLRGLFLSLSRNRRMREWAETHPAARRLSSRFIAGTTLEEGLAVCRKLRGQGITATLDYLGESVTSLEAAAPCRDMYLRIIPAMRDAGLEPNVSLKLTQFGIDFSMEHCEQFVDMVVESAATSQGFVRVDMESGAYTDRTLALVKRLHARHPNCGTVIQAYLKRSEQDVYALTREQIRVRLCKGAYLESPEIAFAEKHEVDLNYLRLAGELLIGNVYPAIATHDERMIETVQRFAEREGIARDRFEFQMLYGIRRDLQQALVEEGYRLRLYVPFGEAWYPYFMRRLAERPANAMFLARNIVRP